MSENCFEPESDTAEVLSSLLLHCHSQQPCSYVDVGCNFGYFAAHAAALGVRSVTCVEPTPIYTEAIERTRQLNGLSASEFVIQTAAVVSSRNMNKGKLPMSEGNAYNPCKIARINKTAAWLSPVVDIRSLVLRAAQPVTLLKIDIDSFDGALLHEVVTMIAAEQVEVTSILVELGDRNSATAWERGRGDTHWTPTPRHGDVNDLRRLQHQLGYDIYRINIHVGREIYDWQGHDVNQLKVPQSPGVAAMYGVRAMKKLERVLPDADYRQLVTWGCSFLITKVQLAEPTVHHDFDLQQNNPPVMHHPWSTNKAPVPVDSQQKVTNGIETLYALNQGNPAVNALV